MDQGIRQSNVGSITLGCIVELYTFGLPSIIWTTPEGKVVVD